MLLIKYIYIYIKPGGKLQKEDFEKYAAEVNTGIKFDLGDLTLVTHGAPSGGPIMGHILDILTGICLYKMLTISFNNNIPCIGTNKSGCK